MHIDEEIFDPASPEDENQHLAEEHGLIKTTAYIHKASARKRSNGAARTAKFRQRKLEQGLVQVYLPVEDAEAIKAAGSVAEWKCSLKRSKFSREKWEGLFCLAKIGLQYKKLPRWKKWLLGI